MESDEFVELDKELIPTGKKIDVANTPFDFRTEGNLLTVLTPLSTQNIVANHGMIIILFSIKHNNKILV